MQKTRNTGLKKGKMNGKNKKFKSLPTEIPLEILHKNLNILYYSINSKQRWESQKFLNNFQNKKKSWKFIFKLSNSHDIKLYYFFLHLLERKVTFSWEHLNKKEKEKIQSFVTKKIFQLTNDLNTMRINSIILTKLDVLLIRIICQSEKRLFFLYLIDFIESSIQSETICENNFKLVLILFEEISSNFKFENVKKLHLNDYRFEEFLKKFKVLIYSIFDQSRIFKSSYFGLTICTLRTLKKLLQFCQKDFYVRKILTETLIILCSIPEMRMYSLDCLVELGNRSSFFFLSSFHEIGEQYILQLQESFFNSKNLVHFLFKTNLEIKEFLTNTSFFFLKFFKNFYHGRDFRIFKKGWVFILCQFMIKMSCMPDFDIFKICLDWWLLFMQIIFAKGCSSYLDHVSRIYFFDLKIILIGRMAKPDEILIRTDESGNTIRESPADTNTKEIHQKEKKILRILTIFEFSSIKFIIFKKMRFQFDDQFWNKGVLNTLCWAIGSIFGTLPTDIENQFLSATIKNLLCLCERKKGIDNKSVVASNIMYIVSQCPRFLRLHWKFLKSVVYKLFEFMQEIHPGIKDMACDTFYKIAQSCFLSFIKLQKNGVFPILDEIFNSLENLTAFLEIHQTKVLYNSLGIIINSIDDDKEKSVYVAKFFQISFPDWIFFFLKKQIITWDPLAIRKVIFMLKLNIYISKIFKKNFFFQIKILFEESWFLYFWACKEIKKLFLNHKKNFLYSKNFWLLKNLRNEISIIFGLYFENCIFNQNNLVVNETILHICRPIFLSYINSIDKTVTDPNLVILSIKLMKKKKNFLRQDLIKLIFHNVFKPTLDMVKLNFEQFPDLRAYFFSLLNTFVCDYFDHIFKLDEDPEKAENDFAQIVHCLVWGIKHPETTISRQTSKTFLAFLFWIQKKNVGHYVYSRFFKQILKDLIIVLTDRLHLSNLKIHCKITSSFLQISKIYVDKIYIKYHLRLIFEKIFPSIDKSYLEKFSILCLVDNNEANVAKEFKKILRTNILNSEESSCRNP